MKKIPFLICFFMFVSFSGFSQKKKDNNQNLPLSIYTIPSQVDINGFSAINKRLQLTSFTFIFFDNKYREFDYFTINPKSFQKNAYTVIDNDLFRFKEKSFQFKIDPTLWPASYFTYK